MSDILILISMSLWNRVQYPERKDITRVFFNTTVVVIGSGIISLFVSSTMNLLVSVL